MHDSFVEVTPDVTWLENCRMTGMQILSSGRELIFLTFLSNNQWKMGRRAPGG